jgi:hypothetical protein
MLPLTVEDTGRLAGLLLLLAEGELAAPAAVTGRMRAAVAAAPLIADGGTSEQTEGTSGKDRRERARGKKTGKGH